MFFVRLSFAWWKSKVNIFRILTFNPIFISENNSKYSNILAFFSITNIIIYYIYIKFKICTLHTFMYIYHRKNINMFIILIKLWHVYFADSKVGTEKIYVLLFQIAEKLFVFFFFFINISSPIILSLAHSPLNNEFLGDR